MKQEWKKLTSMVNEKEMVVTKVHVPEDGISIEGEFELPPLAQLTSDDQIFVAAFVKTHGSIKEMEKLFGVSYPTIKGRLNKIGARFDFLEVSEIEEKESALDRLKRGEISVEDALKEMKR